MPRASGFGLISAMELDERKNIKIDLVDFTFTEVNPF